MSLVAGECYLFFQYHRFSTMQCELCGGASREGFTVLIEGSRVQACPDCARLGKVVGRISKPKKRKPVVVKKKEPKKILEGAEVDIVEDYAHRIQKSREKQGLRQDELGKAICEPASLIHRIESGKLIPSPSVAKRLERKLEIVLFDDDSGDGPVLKKFNPKDPVTLGDVIVVRRKS